MASRGHKKDRRRSAAKPARRSFTRRVLVLGLKLMLLGLVLAVAVLVGGYLWFSRGLPDIKKVQDYAPPQVSRVLAADGTVLAEFYKERRTVVTHDRIAEVLRQAVLAAEDADFYEHEGLDYAGMLRALYNSLRAGRVTGSGSTITQQTVKNLLLTHERSFSRKAKEIILTRRLEGHLSKEEILAIYLSTIYLGHGRYGVQEAAQFYFGKDASEVNISEAATLAGIIQSPERHSPRKHPEAALARRAYVLAQMARNGFITPELEEQIGKTSIELAPLPPERIDEAMWFVNVVKRKLLTALGEEALYEGGLRIHTTLDLKRQRAAMAALRDGLVAVDGRQKFARPLARVGPDKAARWRARRAKALSGVPPSPARPVPGRLETVTANLLIFDLGVGTAAVDRENVERLAVDGELPYSPGDVVMIAVREDGPQHPERMHAVLAGVPQGAMVVLDPQSRDVLALVGGWSYTHYPFDRATQARRQPGSSFKPFVWGAALETGRFTPASILLDAPETWQMSPGKWWKPKNYDGKYRGEVNLRTALAKSINTIAVKITDEIGVNKVQGFARRAGIHSPLADNLTLALGSSEVSPLELANAYASIANDGRPGVPRFITAVVGPDGAPREIGPDAATEDLPEQVFTAEVTWLLRSVMRSVVTAGSGTRVHQKMKGVRTVVGKTGTSNDARDTWFVSLLPDVVVTAWIGFDTPRSLGRKETGGRTVAPVVAEYLSTMERVGADWTPAPPGIEVFEVDPVSGLLAQDDTPNKYTEYFLKGSAPREVAPSRHEVDATDFMINQLGGAPFEDEDTPRLPVAPLPAEDAPRPVAPVRPSPAEAAPIQVRPIKPVKAAPARPALAVPAIPVAAVPPLPDEDEEDDEDRPPR